MAKGNIILICCCASWILKTNSELNFERIINQKLNVLQWYKLFAILYCIGMWVRVIVGSTPCDTTKGFHLDRVTFL